MSASIMEKQRNFQRAQLKSTLGRNLRMRSSREELMRRGILSGVHQRFDVRIIMSFLVFFFFFCLLFSLRTARTDQSPAKQALLSKLALRPDRSNERVVNIMTSGMRCETAKSTQRTRSNATLPPDVAQCVITRSSVARWTLSLRCGSRARIRA